MELQKDTDAAPSPTACSNVVRLEITFEKSGTATRDVCMPILPVGSHVHVDGGDPYSIKAWRHDVNDNVTVCELHFVGDWDYETEPEQDGAIEELKAFGFNFDH